ncbi:MAG: ankyrin repeat domain-containing protein [Acidobacteria bacterium]|nr:ankyrin repeat domain-containing protein [Acidobacteriota bacterium]MYF13395.1 ankyrin repeat domain-containing protein [Acidobacteriota bacterium]MYI95690.1 ankyrin repeat domain-containing protein [Acidobacteriota bacterium]
MRVVTPRGAALGGVLAFVAVLATIAVIRQSTTSPSPTPPADEALAPEPLPDSASETDAAATETGPGSSQVPDGFPVVQMPADNSPAGRLVAAASAGDAERVRELLAAGVPPDSESQGTFAIHRAAVAGSVAALQILVEAGAHLEALDQYGQTALTKAAFYGNAEAVVFLLSAGANPNAHAEPNHQTPLRAILSGWTATLSRRSRLPPKDDQRFAAAWALIRAGADPHFGPGDHPPPVVMAEALGGEIGRLFTGNPTDPGQRPR